MSYGDIYKATNKVNGKTYIGQCQKYQGKFDDEWGYEKRWKSHIYEALHSKDDHCSYLNNAIRKYGTDNFILERIYEADDLEELNALETLYIDEFNTLVPNGYNLDTGGNKGFKLSEQSKQKQSKSKMGLRRKKYNRKFPEDNDLPKYIVSTRNTKDEKTGYKILNFPIGVDEPDYLNIYFNFKNYNSEDECFNNIIEYLNNLKIQYSHVLKKIPSIDESDDESDDESNDESNNQIKHSKKTERKKKDYPPYIYPIHTNDTRRLLIGYFVEGPDYPKKEFTGKTNRWNLNSAVNYILDIDILNKDKQFQIPPLPDDLPKTRTRKNINDNKLPKYMFSVKDKKYPDGFKGFSLKINKIIDENGKAFSKTFAHPKHTLEQKYIDCITELRNQLKTHNITD
jgi:group I intron endonuclease